MANIEQVQYIISELALRHNLVNSAFSGPSIYQINPEVVKEYPFIFISPTGTHVIKENVTRYSFSIFYVDRLLDDSSNENAIFSVAIEVLKNLHRQLRELDFVTDIQEEVNVRLFGESEKMNDRCAGGYMEIWLEVLNAAACGEWFDEFGNPMGEYFNAEEIDNVLDALASKEWVRRLIASISVSGITPEQFEQILSDYTLTKDFATINGEKITNRKKFQLAEKSDLDAVTADVQALQTNAVLSTTVRYIVTLTQEEYDNLPTKDPQTMYITF